METTFESGQSEFRNNGKQGKDLSGTARGLKDTASDEFKNFVSDIEDVVKRVANVSDADVARVREKIQSALYSTKSKLADSAATIKQQAQDAAQQADDYVHESPWQAVGIGAALAAVLGVSIGYLAGRR
jgi:ElaB/YqjD/DUF883 family membrane-anchored ribosome-binding protein